MSDEESDYEDAPTTTTTESEWSLSSFDSDKSRDSSCLKYLNFEKIFYSNDQVPSKRSGHRAVSNGNSLWIWGGFCPQSRHGSPDASPLFPELWKFNLLTNNWRLLVTTGDIPDKTLASHACIIQGNQLIHFGGTSFPFGTSLQSNLYICNLNSLVWKKYTLTGDIPKPSYGSSICIHKNYLYVMFGTNSHEYFSHVYQIDTKTLISKKLFDAVELIEKTPYREHHLLEQQYPDSFLTGRYRQEIFLYDDKIYVLGGGDNQGDACSLEMLPVFDLVSYEWHFVRTQPDGKTKTYPHKRKFHSCLKFADEPYGYVIGGFYFDLQNHSSHLVENSMWRLDFTNLTWTRLDCRLPINTYFHASCTNEQTGQLFFHGGVRLGNNDKQIRINHMFAIRMRIPKLSTICWENLKRIYAYDMNKLRASGLPKNLISCLELDETVSKEKHQIPLDLHTTTSTT